MCELCAAKTIRIGELLPGFLLFRATRDGLRMRAGEYGLVRQDEPFLTWGPVVLADPTPPGLDRFEIEAWMNDTANAEAWGRFDDAAVQFAAAVRAGPRGMGPPSFAVVAELAAACSEAGWTPAFGPVEAWLMDRTARFLEASGNLAGTPKGDTCPAGASDRVVLFPKRTAPAAAEVGGGRLVGRIGPEGRGAEA